MIGDEPVNYGFPFTFDSPTLRCSYKSGRVRIEYDGEAMSLDFSTN